MYTLGQLPIGTNLTTSVALRHVWIVGRPQQVVLSATYGNGPVLQDIIVIRSSFCPEWLVFWVSCCVPADSAFSVISPDSVYY